MTLLVNTEHSAPDQSQLHNCYQPLIQMLLNSDWCMGACDFTFLNCSPPSSNQCQNTNTEISHEVNKALANTWWSWLNGVYTESPVLTCAQ